jgi:thiol-disulfide isomerase/thioredoxin
MSPKPAIAITVAALALALGACGDDEAGNPDSELTPEEARAPVSDAPAELAAIREQANELLGGGSPAFADRLDELQGTPVVVNNWGSWCGPCRAEFPYFQKAAISNEDAVAFLGVDTDDSDKAAETFLSELPLPYPSYTDPDRDISEEYLDHPFGLPATAFYDSRGERAFVHQGPYTSEADLQADIDRYAR